MSREKDCRWHFGLESGREQLSDPMSDHFRDDLYTSLVRESIQNSLDAAADNKEPVRVEFKYKSLNSWDFPNFFGLRDHIKGCIDYYGNKAKAVYSPMLKAFPEDDGLKRQIPYLRVADYNTKGMSYTPGNTESTFYAFVRAIGVTVKDDSGARGGSFGYGKAAYYKMSPFSTVFISTMDTNLHRSFEGASGLSTHIINGEVLTSVGYYDNNNGKPITNGDDIPVPFRRDEPGSNIDIIGIQKENDSVDNLLREVIRNFWLAIHEELLVVVVEDIELNKDNLFSMMKRYFPHMADNTKRNASTFTNPRPYYDAVLNVDADDNHKMFVDKLPILGKVKLYTAIIPEEEGMERTKVVFMRSLKMHVFTQKYNLSNSIAAVFVCENNYGNRILGHLEPPAHNEWKAKNWKDERGRTVPDGQEALDEIRQFIEQCFRSINKMEEGDSTDITELEDYLPIPSDLLPDDDEETKAKGNNPKQGELGDIDENGTHATTHIDEPIDENKEVYGAPDNGQVTSVTSGGFSDTGSGKTGGVHQRSTGKKKKRGTGSSPGTKPSKQKFDPTLPGTYSEVVDVDYSVIAKTQNGKLWHDIFIHVDDNYDNVLMNVIVCGEGSDEKLAIAESDKGTLNENQVYGLSLYSGINKVSVRFNDQVRHTLTLEVYED
ncbi:hypothetical protein SAMN04487900_11711 [Prevotella communis]|uniref:Uncharacterized protein n=1 Tax=Prevotella communis TaxID=2913614 RepID=A0A1H0IWI9_9BACT|nr:hypothetical protein [Prevotella communis]SDO35864.1 hypothetical protein SAMN04487900_11711 [Prevotella communis]